MSQTDLPTHPPTDAALTRARGGRTILLVLTLCAVIGTLLYLLRAPAERQFATLSHAPRAPTLALAPASAPDPRLPALAAQLLDLRGRVDALEQHAATLPPPSIAPAGAPAGAPADTALTQAISARIDALAAQLAAQAAQLKTDEAHLQTTTGQTAAIASLTDRTTRLARLQAATAALASGLPLGVLPGAPAALARFEADPPPTEAQLRAAFAPVAAHARAVARPDTAGRGLWGSAKARLGALITIRRGDTTLVGDSQITALDRAAAALQAGDLAGAVAALSTLTGPAADATAAWHARAQSLLDARVALAKLAGQG